MMVQCAVLSVSVSKQKGDKYCKNRKHIFENMPKMIDILGKKLEHKGTIS